MANLLNLLYCYTAFGNTGTSVCDKEPGLITSLTLIPNGYRFTQADTATSDAFVTAIQAGLLADNPRNRFFHFGPFQEVTANGEAPVVQTFGYGAKRQVRRGTIAYDFLVTGGKGKHAQHLKFSGSKLDAILHDSTDTVWGQTATDAQGNRVLAGYRVSNFFVGDYQVPNGQTGGQWMITIEFTETSALQENYGYVDLDRDPFAAGTGFLPVIHTATSASATNVTVTAATTYGADLIATFADEFAQTTGGKFAFIVKNADPTTPNFGNEITISSVVKTGIGWILTLAATGTDPDNPGAGKKVSVGLNLPSVLAGFTIPVTGFITPDPVIVTLGA